MPQPQPLPFEEFRERGSAGNFMLYFMPDTPLGQIMRDKPFYTSFHKTYPSLNKMLENKLSNVPRGINLGEFLDEYAHRAYEIMRELGATDDELIGKI
jgi:hypothetical protein